MTRGEQSRSRVHGSARQDICSYSSDFPCGCENRLRQVLDFGVIVPRIGVQPHGYAARIHSKITNFLILSIRHCHMHSLFTCSRGFTLCKPQSTIK